MRIFYLLLVLIVLLSGNCQTAMSASLFNVTDGGFEIGLEQRYDQLDWSIAYRLDGGTPNTYSELSWDNLEIVQLSFSPWLELGQLPYLDSNTLVQVDISGGRVFAGDYQDSDYATDNRGDEWSRSIGDGDEGFVVDISGGFGPIIKLEKLAGVSITPMVGYGFNMQELSMTNGLQTVSRGDIRAAYFSTDSNGELSMPLPNGNFAGLDSSYTAYWYGPWLGVKIDYQVNKDLNFSIGAEHHWVEYFAQADWNLRTDFEHPVSFEHETTGTGIVGKIDVEYILNEKWSLLVSGNMQEWETVGGSVRTFKADGSVSKTRLNQVNWDSYALKAGVGYRF